MPLASINIIIPVILGTVSVALADTTPRVTELPSPPSCEILNMVNETHLLKPTAFKTTLERCSNDSKLNVGAILLLDVFHAISKDQCSFTDATYVEENKLIDCVKEETDTPSFSVVNAKSNFGLVNTYSLQIRKNECKKSEETANCVEKVFSEKKWDRNMKNCKNDIMRGFQVTSIVCFNVLLRDDRGSGYAILPTKPLIFSTTLMLIKVIMLSGF